MINKRELRKLEIEDKIRGIMDALEIVEENLPEDFDSFKNLGLVKDGIYKKVEFAIESILDICFIINSDLRLGAPEKEEDIFTHLKIGRIFSKEIIELIIELKKFRNILVHRYGEIDDEQAYHSIKEGLTDFEIIIKEFERFLKKN